VVQTDDALFGQLDFADIPRDEIRLPNEEEIEEEIRKGNLNPGHAKENTDGMVITGEEFE
jgi:hypothetical protein